MNGIRNHSVRISRLTLGLTLGLALAFGALASISADAANTPVRISLPAKTTSFSALFVAQAKNFLKENGLDLKVTVVSGIGAVQAMFSGSVEFSGLTGAEVIKSRAKGLKPIFISTWIDRMNMEIIADKAKATAAGLTESSSLQEKLQFMKGRTIGVLRTGAVAHFDASS